MADLCVFTANPDRLLLESGHRVGIDIVSYPADPWRSFIHGKTILGAEFLKTRAEPFAMWVDGYDSLILKSETEIISRLNAPVLISAERNCFPDFARAAEFPDTSHLPTFVCAGGYIGRREDLIAALETVAAIAKDGDDQRAWTEAYLSGAVPGLMIDHWRRIFCSEGDGDTAGADPATRHWNGRVPGREEFYKVIKWG